MANDPDLPDALLRTLDRLGRRKARGRQPICCIQARSDRWPWGRQEAMGGHDPRAAPGNRTQGGHGALGKSEGTAARYL